MYYEGCFITAMNGGDLDYASSDPVTFQLTIRFQNCTGEGDLFPLTPAISAGATLS
jgi:hypothetical protein